MATAHVAGRPHPATTGRAAPASRAGSTSASTGRLRWDRATCLALAMLLLLVALAAAADLLAARFFRYGVSQQNLLSAYTPPTLADPAMWLGSDDVGRSQVVRLLYGGRVSLAVGFGAAVVDLAIGVTLGLAAGYFRGWLDDVILWGISTVDAIPALFLLLLVAVLFTPGPATLIVILGLLSCPRVALFVRGQTFSLRQREFVTAARVLGASHGRLLARHILPNVLPLVLVVAAVDVGSIVLAESALSFLGLGIAPPTPSWGNMLANASASFARGPWLVYGPGAAIFTVVLCLHLVGDGLRDALDPRLRSR